MTPRSGSLSRIALLVAALCTAACGRVTGVRLSVAPPTPRSAGPEDSTLVTVALADAEAVVPDRRVLEPVGAARGAQVDTTRLARAVDTIAAIPEYRGDLPMLELDAYAAHDRVEHYVRLFTGTARERTIDRLSRGTRYEAMIRAKLRAGGIPEDLRFLALIESGFDPDAFSSAAAVGMWQFMSSTARGVGLRVDWWMDERRDVVKATDAAVRFLNDLHGQFGSVYLAAAAYNGGPGRVQRGLTRYSTEIDRTHPDERFFTLASKNVLAAETKNYVPQLIAAALIGRDPVAFGIAIDTQPDFVYDSVAVPPATALAAIGTACAATVTEIVGLNGHILRGMTPPDRESYFVRVPVGCAAGFAERWALLAEEERAGVLRHTVTKGETLVGLAKTAGITTTVLRQYNPKLTVLANGTLRTGSTIVLPTAATRAAARSVPDPLTGRSSTASSGATYVVRRGDTLGEIAKRHGTTVARLQKLNGLRTTRIKVGAKLRVR